MERKERIDRLIQASMAGVPIRMVVRGICCLRAGVPGYTDNVQVVSIVGRFLEHSRIYVFGEGAQCRVYISSADLMTRNMDRRVEVACPIRSREARAKIHRIIQVQLMDDTKARRMGPDGTYRPVPARSVPINCHQVLMADAVAHAPAPPAKGRWRSVLSWLRDRSRR